MQKGKFKLNCVSRCTAQYDTHYNLCCVYANKDMIKRMKEKKAWPSSPFSLFCTQYTHYIRSTYDLILWSDPAARGGGVTSNAWSGRKGNLMVNAIHSAFTCYVVVCVPVWAVSTDNSLNLCMSSFLCQFQ